MPRSPSIFIFFFFFFNDTATTEIYTLSLHDALPICLAAKREAGRLRIEAKIRPQPAVALAVSLGSARRSEEHTSELQSQFHLVCRLLLEKKKKKINKNHSTNKQHTNIQPTTT